MKVYIGRAIYEGAKPLAVESWENLLIEMEKRHIPHQRGTLAGDGLICRARSIIASEFFRSDCDVLLFLDADIGFDPADAIRLCEGAVKKLSILGGFYVTRHRQSPAISFMPGQKVLFSKDSNLVEVPYLSTGFMAIHKNVFRALSARPDMPLCGMGLETTFWPFFADMVIPWSRPLPAGAQHVFLSEDWAFCERAKQDGFKLWLNPSIRLMHQGETPFVFEDMFRSPRPATGAFSLEISKDLGSIHAKRVQNGQEVEL